jgi:hypothetical protein
VCLRRRKAELSRVRRTTRPPNWVAKHLANNYFLDRDLVIPIAVPTAGASNYGFGKSTMLYSEVDVASREFEETPCGQPPHGRIDDIRNALARLLLNLRPWRVGKRLSRSLLLMTGLSIRERVENSGKDSR